MSKTEILDQLAELNFHERLEISSFLWELETKEIFAKELPSAEEKYLLDQALEEYNKNPNAGSAWNEVKARILLKI